VLHGTPEPGKCLVAKKTVKIRPVLREEAEVNTSWVPSFPGGGRPGRLFSEMTCLTVCYLEGLLEHLIGQIRWMDGG